MRLILLGAIGVLTDIFFFQDWFVRRPVLYDRVRLAFLVLTLFWIGWYAQAQLSVVNVLAFLNALRGEFRGNYFLMAPLIFILWFATAVSMLFWTAASAAGGLNSSRRRLAEAIRERVSVEGRIETLARLS